MFANSKRKRAHSLLLIARVDSFKRSQLKVVGKGNLKPSIFAWVGTYLHKLEQCVSSECRLTWISFPFFDWKDRLPSVFVREKNSKEVRVSFWYTITIMINSPHFSFLYKFTLLVTHVQNNLAKRVSFKWLTVILHLTGYTQIKPSTCYAISRIKPDFVLWWGDNIIAYYSDICDRQLESLVAVS